MRVVRDKCDDALMEEGGNNPTLEAEKVSLEKQLAAECKKAAQQRNGSQQKQLEVDIRLYVFIFTLLY